MSDVNIEISKDVVQGIIEKKISAAVLEAFTDKDELVRKMINLALTRKVNHNGLVSSSSYDNKFDLIDVLFSKALKEAAESAIKDAIEKHQPQLRAAIEKELGRKQSALAKLMVANMNDSLGGYNFKLEVEPK